MSYPPRLSSKLPEQALKAIRFQLESIVECSDDAIIAKTLEGVILSWNKSAQRMFGYTEAEAVGKPITIIIPPELEDEENDILRRLRAGERIQHYETRRVRKDGNQIDISLTVSPVRDARGRIIGASKIARDITERKRAEAALSTVRQKLIEAHEEERTQIARELHDDINQRMALLAVALEGLKKAVPASATQLREKIGEAFKQAQELGSDIQVISHRLSSSKLRYLGLKAAANSFCREVSDRHGVKIDFQSQNIPNDLSEDVSACLFRTLQEAVQNAIKHSGISDVSVMLQRDSNGIHLTVRDSGVGFDPEQAIKGPGLGLINMRERLKLVDGHLSIDSNPHSGTVIHAWVPLRPVVQAAVA